MPVSKRAKYRGSRTCGGGTHKNRRGAGNRGGRGHSGGCKHHFVKYYLLEGRVFGKNGFKTARETLNVIDIGNLDLMIPSPYRIQERHRCAALHQYEECCRANLQLFHIVY